jgi:hypothetical protein
MSGSNGALPPHVQSIASVFGVMRVPASASATQATPKLTARQAQMERRYEALEQAEAAVARKASELDELEIRLGIELKSKDDSSPWSGWK